MTCSELLDELITQAKALGYHEEVSGPVTVAQFAAMVAESRAAVLARMAETCSICSEAVPVDEDE